MGSYDSGGQGNGSGLIDPSDLGAKHLKQRKDHFYNSSYVQNSSFWIQANIDKRFKVGDQTLWSMIYGDNQYYQARRFFFNLIRRHVNMICGFQRKNRKSTVVVPFTQQDQLCDDYNAVLKWSENRDGFQEYLSQSFEGSVDVGENMLWLYPNFINDPISGDLFTDSVAAVNYLIDPFYRKQDLSDCNGIWRRRWVSKEAAKALLPGHAKEIDKMRPSGCKDGRFPLQAELINLDMNRLFTYDEYHYLDSREATLIIDPKSGEAVEWEQDEDDPEDMMQQTLAQQPWLRTKKVQVPTVKLCISLGDKEMYNGPNLLGIDSYPCVPTLCYHETDIQAMAWRKQGIVRNLRDAQYLYNRQKVIQLSIIESQISSGWIYPVDVVTDPKAFRQTGEGFLIPLKAGRSASEIQRIDPPVIPQSLMELSANLADDITKISGVNEELLGAATDDKSGILSMLRQGAGLTTLQTIFDKVDYTQRLYGKIRLQAIRKNFSKGKIRNILGREPSPNFFTSHSLKYDVAVEEGNYSATQRQTELQQLLYFREIGMPIADKSILNAAFITNKKQVIEDMEAQQQRAMEQQQAQSQQQEKMDNADVMVKYAKARSELAKEKELMASTQEKYAKIEELQSKAEHEKSEADLNLVKMMIELEDLDLANLRSSLELAEIIKLQNSGQIATQTA